MPHPQVEVTIRPLHAGDAAALHAAVRSSLTSLSQWLPWATDDYDIDRARDWIAWCDRQREADLEHHFGIFATDDDTLLGGVGLNQRSFVNRSAHMGYWVTEAARGRGIAVAAARQAARFGFDRLSLLRIAILLQPVNRASLRVAIKLGAVCEGVARNAIVLHGHPHEALVHSLIPADLEMHDLEMHGRDLWKPGPVDDAGPVPHGESH